MTQQSGGSNCKDCEEKDNATQKIITAERLKVCSTLYDAYGTASQMEEKFEGEKLIYDHKKCTFTWTEYNYQLYRNLEITVGTELLQTNESLKGNVGIYSKLNKDLGAQLQNIGKGIKDMRTKIGELNEAACKLKHSAAEKCNSAQWKAITGWNATENCKDGKESSDGCDHAKEWFDDLVGKKLGMVLTDFDSLFQSSYDVVGIQLFSSMDTIEQLQKDLETYSKKFESQVKTTMDKRAADLSAAQQDLTTTVKELTKAAMDRNSSRSDFEGYKDAIEFLCCPVCDCAKDPKGGDKDGDCGCHGHDGRLKKCEKEICCICDDVKKTFCCDAEPKNGDTDC